MLTRSPGEQLENLHQTRSTAQNTSLLLSYYLSLTHQTAITGENTSPLEQLFATRTSRQGREKLAVVLRRLMAIAKDVADNAATALSEAEAGAVPKEVTNGDGESQEPVVSQKVISKRRMEREKAERVRDEIEGYCERFEKELLKLFDRSYKKGDPRMMAVSVVLARHGPGILWLMNLNSTAPKHFKNSTEEPRVSRYTSTSMTFSSKITARLKKMNKTASALICRSQLCQNSY